MDPKRKFIQEHPGPPLWPSEALPALAHRDSSHYLIHLRGLSEDEVEEYDLAYCDGGYWNRRVLIPMYGEHGQLRAFQGRLIDPCLDPDLRYRTSGPRPLYAPWTVAGETQLCVTEGPFDVFNVQRVCPAVATLGISPSPAQVGELIQLIEAQKIRRVLIWFDAGASVEAFALQLKLAPHLHTEVILNDTVKDPGDATPEQIQDILSAQSA